MAGDSRRFKASNYLFMRAWRDRFAFLLSLSINQSEGALDSRSSGGFPCEVREQLAVCFLFFVVLLQGTVPRAMVTSHE